MNSLQISLTNVSEQAPAHILWLPGAILFLFLAFCWVLCVAAAFVGVRRTTFSASVIALGLGGGLAFVTASVLTSLLPDLAREFTAPGLLFFSFMCVAPIVCVPLIEHSWDTTYKQGFASIVLSLALFFFTWSVLHTLLQPQTPDAARISLPVLFQPDL